MAIDLKSADRGPSWGLRAAPASRRALAALDPSNGSASSRKTLRGQAAFVPQLRPDSSAPCGRGGAVYCPALTDLIINGPVRKLEHVFGHRTGTWVKGLDRRRTISMARPRAAGAKCTNRGVPGGGPTTSGEGDEIRTPIGLWRAAPCSPTCRSNSGKSKPAGSNAYARHPAPNARRPPSGTCHHRAPPTKNVPALRTMLEVIRLQSSITAEIRAGGRKTVSAASRARRLSPASTGKAGLASWRNQAETCSGRHPGTSTRPRKVAPRFVRPVRTRSNLPVVTLVDVPGYKPGSDQETRRHHPARGAPR